MHFFKSGMAFQIVSLENLKGNGTVSFTLGFLPSFFLSTYFLKHIFRCVALAGLKLFI